MEITDFVNRIQANATDWRAREEAQIVKSCLSENCGLKERLVRESMFNKIIEATGITPTIGSVYKFIRIHDLGNNSVDIQTTK